MNDNKPKSPLYILDNFLSTNASNLFTDQGLPLLRDGICELENRAIKAMVAAGKTSLQEKVGTEIALDIFLQSYKMSQRCNRLLSLMVCYKTAELSKVSDDFCNALKALITRRFSELLDRDEALCTLVQSVIHLMKPDDGLKAEDIVKENDDD